MSIPMTVMLDRASPIPAFRNVNHRNLLLIASLALLAACAPAPPPVTGTSSTPAICEALRPAMPIQYSGTKDTPETVKQVRQANARFQAACP